MDIALRNTIRKHSLNFSKKAVTLKIALIIALLVWITGIFYPAFNSITGNILLHSVLKYNYSLVCHQDQEKSISISGENLFVCSRCTGIYLGALFSSFALLLFNKIKRTKLKYFTLALFLMLLDVFLVNTGIYFYQKAVSFGTGFLFGTQTFLLIHEILEEFISFKKVPSEI